jgi:hypothetical protein
MAQRLGHISFRHQAQAHHHLTKQATHFLLRHKCPLKVAVTDFILLNQVFAKHHGGHSHEE